MAIYPYRGEQFPGTHWGEDYGSVVTNGFQTINIHQFAFDTIEDCGLHIEAWIEAVEKDGLIGAAYHYEQMWRFRHPSLSQVGATTTHFSVEDDVGFNAETVDSGADTILTQVTAPNTPGQYIHWNWTIRYSKIYPIYGFTSPEI